MATIELAENIVRVLAKGPKVCAVVDSDRKFTEPFAKVLNNLGFEVFVFNNSTEFVTQSEEYRFDIVVIAWDVQPISGMQVVEKIRNAGVPYPAIVIACDVGESVSFQLAISPVGFLFKPFEAGQLMQILSKSIGDN